MILKLLLAFEILILPSIIVYYCLHSKPKDNYWVLILMYRFVILAGIIIVTWSLSVILNTDWHIIILTLLGILFSITFYLLTTKNQCKKLFYKIFQQKEFIYFEIISFLLFIFLSYLRTFQSAILSTEKFMDMGFITSFLKQKTMPPENPWLSGIVLNYYYLGQFTVSALLYITQIPPNIGYNLAISLWGVLIFQAFFLSLRLFTSSTKKSFASAFILTFGGNLILISYWLKHKTLDSNSISFSSATRVIKYTINEFCSYSIYLGDLHGHFLSFPFLIILITFMVYYLNQLHKQNADIYKFGIILGVLTSFIFATNAWDILVSLETISLLSLFLLSSYFFKYRRQKDKEKFEEIVIKLITLAISYLLSFLPFYILFKHFFIPPLNGIGIIKNLNTLRNDMQYWFKLWGQFIIIMLTAIINFLFTQNQKDDNNTKFIKNVMLILFTIGVLNVVAVSFIYLKDFFSFANEPYKRANTVFKIYYESWFLIGGSTFTLFILSLQKVAKIKGRDIKNALLFESMIFLILVTFSMLIYIPKSINDFLGGKQVLSFKNFKQFVIHPSEQLNGESFLGIYDKFLLDKLKQLTEKKRVVIAEYIDYNSYSRNGRFQVFSGNTLVTGWPFHNAQWYNTQTNQEALALKYPTYQQTNIVIDDRVRDIQAIYNPNTDVSTLQNIIYKYKIKYVMIGEIEREKVSKISSQYTNNINNESKNTKKQTQNLDNSPIKDLKIFQICHPIYEVGIYYYILECPTE